MAAALQQQVSDLADLLAASPVDMMALRSLLGTMPAATVATLFDQLRSALGPGVASRLWLEIFGASDASET